MALDRRFPQLIGATLIALVTLFSFTPSSAAEFPFDIVCTVGDTTGSSGELNTVISVYLDNYNDTLAGFEVWIQLDRPDLIKFQTNTGIAVDTTYWICNSWDGSNCTDSTPSNPLQAWDFIHVETKEIEIGNHDTTGTLISGWQHVDSRSLSGLGFDISLTAFANKPEPPFTHGIAPQQGGLLFKILADVFDIPDTVLERTVNLIIQHDFIDNINFSRNNGTSIGIEYEQFMDSTCYVCLSWCGAVCCNLKKVSIPPGGDYANCDSLWVQQDSSAYLDTTRVILVDGSLTVTIPPPFICGDIDGSGGNADISDLTALVDFLFRGGGPPVPMEAGDLDCSGGGSPVGITDLTLLVDYLFRGGAAPCATCP